MGRHRSDPLGIARLALVGLVAVLLLAVIVVGARALLSTFGSEEPASGAASTSSARPSAAPSAEPSTPRVPTVRVVCRADRCPVFVRVPGGDVLIDRDLARGEEASYFQPELDVVLDDASTVQIFENGTVRSPGPAGERQAFSVKRSADQASDRSASE
ncbi:hypothetical protein [Microbispora rosea]|uniref:DUF4115 domain-containing protein n=1 Tax=Microbispora rosea TaxID=58117 RepID=A0A1N7CPN8_9ACTN|nr:hypothetical protein [Microbispora rosea]GIH46421.1 hypothetical protein Mro03_16000 [Microbispora rosea subsp. rosea]SIR65532.1 hypothetical protein SAMN05421833_112125 [Microbispora rosea]